jgi:hypothetical protein
MSDVQPIDFETMDADDFKKVVNAVAILANYNIEKKEVGEAIKETLDSLCDELKADKGSAAQIKKTVRKAATIWANNKVDDIRYENEMVDILLSKVNKHAIESDDE